MSIIHALRRRGHSEPEVRDAPLRLNEFVQWWDAYYGGADRAMRNAASWACINALADAVSRTPFDAIRDRDGAHIPIEPSPALLRRPSGLVRRDVWRFQLAWSLLTDGNAFGMIVGVGRDGYPSQIELLDPKTVTQREVVGGVARGRVDQKEHRLYPDGKLWHVAGKTVPPGTPFALSPLTAASSAIGTSLAAEEFSSRYFSDGGHPSAIIYADKDLGPNQAGDIKTAFLNATRGNRDPAVMGSGLKYEPVSSTPEQAQPIDLMRFEVEEICRFWGVPPSMVFGATSGQNVTYANVTQADLDWLKRSLEVYFVRVEEALTDTIPGPQFVRANRNAILRADVQGRYTAYQTALMNRFTTVNEVRALEDLPPFPDPDFDEPGVPPWIVPGAPVPVPEPATMISGGMDA